VAWNEAPTVILAVAVLPAPTSNEVTVTELIAIPSRVPVMFTLTVHDAVAPRLAPDRLMLLLPGVTVKVPPTQVVVAPLSVDTTRPGGSVSLKLTVNENELFGFVMVKFRLVVPPTGIATAPNDLLIVGRATTVNVAVEEFPGSLLAEVTVTVLVFTPVVMPLTFTLNVHEAPIPSVAPDREIKAEPDVAVIVPPPQEPVCSFGVPTTTPAGKVSVKLMPLTGVAFEGGLMIVKVSAAIPFSGMVDGVNDFKMDGGNCAPFVVIVTSDGALLKKPLLTINCTT
jgi:hypothetical protein